MIRYEEALRIILKQAKPVAAMMLPIAKAVGHICADNIASEVAVPPFANSAMDGFAVQSAMLKKTPVVMAVAGSTAAGDMPGSAVRGAWEIMTGAPVPNGYDAVVRVEDVEIRECDEKGHPRIVVFSQPIEAGDNVREAGEDFQPGDLVINRGTLLEPQHVMALSTLGIDSVPIYSRPRVAIIATGKELVDDVELKLKPGQIRNGNTPYLLSALTLMGGEAVNSSTIHDEPQIFEQTLREMMKQEMTVVISTGAVSAGRYDFVPESLKKLGAEILFHKVAIRPGKPILYALLPNGTHYFGLPGNPISAAVGLRFFVCPLLHALQCLGEEKPVYASITDNVKKKTGLRFFQKAHVYLDHAGQWHASILPGQESFKVHPLLNANAWVVLPEDMTEGRPGSIIATYPLYPGIWCNITPKQEQCYDSDRIHQRASA